MAAKKVKNVNSVQSAGIRTHYLQNLRCLHYHQTRTPTFNNYLCLKLTFDNICRPRFTIGKRFPSCKTCTWTCSSDISSTSTRKTPTRTSSRASPSCPWPGRFWRSDLIDCQFSAIITKKSCISLAIWCHVTRFWTNETRQKQRGEYACGRKRISRT